MRLLTSPRARRRAAWTLLPLLALGGAAAAIALVPSREVNRAAEMPTGTQRAVLLARRVPLTARERRAIDALLDRFVPAAVERRDTALAYRLATPALRRSATRTEWRRGDIPVFPLDVRGQTFRGWQLNEATPGRVSLDLLLGAAKPGDVTGIAYTVHVRRIAGAWRVDSMTPAAIFHNHAITSERDFLPPAVAPHEEGGGSRAWIALPLALVGAALLFPLAFFGSRWLRDRRAAARYRAERGSSLPPLPGSARRDVERV